MTPDNSSRAEWVATRDGGAAPTVRHSKNASATLLCLLCGRGEGVQGVLTLFCSGAAQVCHVLRVVELREQLEVEEEDGDRQEEEVEEKREKRIKEGAPC